MITCMRCGAPAEFQVECGGHVQCGPTRVNVERRLWLCFDCSERHDSADHCFLCEGDC